MNNVITFFTQSSENPEKTSATLTGILIAAASWVHQFASVVPVIDQVFKSPVGQQLDPLLTAIGMIVGGVWFLFGLFRKLTNKVETKVIV